MNRSAMTLWQAIDAVIAQIPFSKTGIERVLSTTFSDADPPGNEKLRLFEGAAVRLADDVEISGIDLRVRRTGPHAGFMVLDLAGRPVPAEEVARHYTGLELSGVPRGQSLDEAIGFTAALSWGRLSFGFSERAPQCLVFVAFAPS